MANIANTLFFPGFSTPMVAGPVTQDKVFSTSAFETVVSRADVNKDGQMSRDELNSLIVSDGRYADVDYQAASVLQNNFQGIANRARKQGEPEIATFAYDPSVDTIDIQEVRKLAGFDGNAATITKADVSLLANNNVLYWPQVPVTTPPTPSPEPTPTPNPSQNNFKKLLQLLFFLILFGGGIFGGRSR